MARLLYDFSDPEQAKKYPRHGWAENSQGANLLWVPLKTLLHRRNHIRQLSGFGKPLQAARLDAATTFGTTLRRLVSVLRDLHCAADSVAGISMVSSTADEERTWYEALQRAELCVDIAYVYLRRLAYHLAFAVSPLLFAKYGSAPQSFNTLRDKAVDKKLDHLQPICDTELLRDAFLSHSKWFDVVRKDFRGSNLTGVRSALEHRIAHTAAGSHGTANQPQVLHVHLHSRHGDVPVRRELVGTLGEILEELCQFWTALQGSIVSSDLYPATATHQYTRLDPVVVYGTDDDIVAFWPRL